MRREQNTPPSLVQAYLISHCSTTSRIHRAKSFSATQSLKSTGNNIGVCRSITTYRSGIHSFTRSVSHFKVRQVPTGQRPPDTCPRNRLHSSSRGRGRRRETAPY